MRTVQPVCFEINKWRHAESNNSKLERGGRWCHRPIITLATRRNENARIHVAKPQPTLRIDDENPESHAENTAPNNTLRTSVHSFGSRWMLASENTAHHAGTRYTDRDDRQCSLESERA
jgi:hypothetical protein